MNTIELYHEDYRPQFHFTSLANWLNDPNGLVYYAGEYHLFFQHNPTGINWGNMHWGHAVSSDLVHWEQLPVSLDPDSLGAIFSGSAAVDWQNTTGFQTGPEPPLIAMYTAAGSETPESSGQPYTQCLAYSNDRGRTWNKYRANPVLPHVVGQNRDPKVFWHAPRSCWIMSLFLDGEDFALFSSPNLKHWTRIQTIHLPGASECPDLFALRIESEPEKEAWVFTGASGHYLVGDFDGRHFSQFAGPLRLDFGANFYAAQTFSDVPTADGRRIQIAWMAGGAYPGMNFNQQMTFPCTLTLHRTVDGLRLFRYPVREIELLRQKGQHYRNLTIEMGAEPLSNVTGEIFDVLVEVAAQSAGVWSLLVRGQEISYNFADKTLNCLGSSAKLRPEEGKIRLRVLVDRTSIEIFGNDGRVSMSFCFNPEPGEEGLELRADGPPARILAMDVYELESSWRESIVRGVKTEVGIGVETYANN